MPFLILMRLPFMTRILLFLTLLVAAGCSTATKQTTTAESLPLHSYSTHIYKTTRSNIIITVTDKSDGQTIPGSVICIIDTLNRPRIGKIADMNGQWQIKTEPDKDVFENASGMKFTMIGYQPLLLLNPRPQSGDSIVVQLHPLPPTSCCYTTTTYWDPLTDFFSPQNKTIQREEIRRMPR